MYLHSTYLQQDDIVQQACTKPPFGPGFSQDAAKKAAKMEVWATNFTDPGEDYCLFKLFDAAGTVIGENRVDGF